MPDPQIVKTLTTKAKDIQAYIGDLERQLEEARADLSHVLATLRLFSAQEGERPVTAYMNLARLFPRHELPRLATTLLSEHPKGLDTRTMALEVVGAKGLDVSDRHLRKALAYKLVQVLRRWERQGKVIRAGKRGSAILWKPV